MATLLWCALCQGLHGAPLKPRIVVLTDISPAEVEPDDMQSLIRLLVYADQLEIEALIATTGWSSDGDRADWIRLIHEGVEAYAKDLPNLQKRSGQRAHLTKESRQEIGYWPSSTYLKSIAMLGSQKRGMAFVGEGNDSPGSEFLIKLADEPDERPIWVQGWGSGNTLAQAIWRVKQTRTSAQLTAFLRKLRFYAITDQDRGYQKGVPFEISSHQWMRREFERDLVFVWDESAWTFQAGTGKRLWQDYINHVQGRGHLGRLYPKYKYGVEGDTPSFLYVLPNGMNDPEHPNHGGWGGFFEWGLGPDQATRAYVNQPGLPAHQTSRGLETRFYTAVFNDFVARLDWAVNGAGNRNPIVVIGDDRGQEPIRVATGTDAAVTLDASRSEDPDGDSLKFSWWRMPEAGGYDGPVEIDGASQPRASIRIPKDTEGKSIHIICEVTDQGTPALTSYRRVLLQPQPSTLLPGKPSRPADALSSQRPRVVILTDFPPLDVIPGGAGQGPAEKRSDPDDIQSMVRFLVYANEFDVEGLVATAGTFANIARKQHLLDLLNLYDQVDDNLRTHDPRYPTASQLRQVVWQGRDGSWGKPAAEVLGEGRDSEASEALIHAVDRPDPRPLWVCVWGGPSELAQAIWRVKKTRDTAEFNRFIAKLRVFLIGLGDLPAQDGSGQWLLDEFPELFVIVSQRTYGGMFAQGSPLGNLAWINDHVRQNHGALGAAYPRSGFNPNNPGQQEGDSPSFLYLYSAAAGMTDPDQPTQENWGGQYQRRNPAKRHWYDGPGPSTISKWLPDIQRDFARRMDWCLKP